MFSPGSRERLTSHDLGRFPGDTLFHCIARAVCEAGRLPRKELFEAWEVARRTRRLFRGGRVLDMGGGHGLLAHIMLLLDDTSPVSLVVDPNPPASQSIVHDALTRRWPRLAGRVQFLPEDLGRVPMTKDDIVVASHACGALTDALLERAAVARARVAVLPCCQDADVSDTGELTGWIDGPLAVDVVRALALRARGYRIWTQSISAAVTPKNRLLLGEPKGLRPSDGSHIDRQK